MVTLINLQGRAAKETKAVFLRTAADVHKIQKDLALTAAGQNGAINIWISDTGEYYCEAYKSLRTVNTEKYETIDDVEKWAETWIKKIT